MVHQIDNLILIHMCGWTMKSFCFFDPTLLVRVCILADDVGTNLALHNIWKFNMYQPPPAVYACRLIQMNRSSTMLLSMSTRGRYHSCHSGVADYRCRRIHISQDIYKAAEAFFRWWPTNDKQTELHIYYICGKSFVSNCCLRKSLLYISYEVNAMYDIESCQYSVNQSLKKGIS